MSTELAECIEDDNDALWLWNETIYILLNDEVFDCVPKISEIIEQSEVTLEKCGKNQKLRSVGAKMDDWWGSYWSMGPTAMGLAEFRYMQNMETIGMAAQILQKNWEGGQMFDAGESFAVFWSQLIGDASDDFDSVMQFAGGDEYELDYPLSDFYAAFYNRLFGEWKYE